MKRGKRRDDERGGDEQDECIMTRTKNLLSFNDQAFEEVITPTCKALLFVFVLL